MNKDEERERAWGGVHDAVGQMPGWVVGPCTCHGEVGLWHINAIDLRPSGRYAKREAVTRDRGDRDRGPERLAGAPRGPPAKRR